jgi:hypothetical protein
MKDLDWHTVGHAKLAAMLAATTPVSSSAVGSATVYRIEQDGRELLAIALPDGETIVVERTKPARRRRRVDARAVSPASR